TVLFGSEEYYQSVGGNNSDWLNQLYEQRLGRPIDQDGLAYWETALADGASRQDVASAVAHTPEAAAATGVDVYFKTLHRKPEPAGLEYWQNALLGGMTREEFEAAVASSDEGTGLVAAGGDLNGVSPLAPVPASGMGVVKRPTLIAYYGTPLGQR